MGGKAGGKVECPRCKKQVKLTASFRDRTRRQIVLHTVAVDSPMGSKISICPGSGSYPKNEPPSGREPRGANPRRKKR